jgi:hypothetical protein
VEVVVSGVVSLAEGSMGCLGGEVAVGGFSKRRLLWWWPQWEADYWQRRFRVPEMVGFFNSSAFEFFPHAKFLIFFSRNF